MPTISVVTAVLAGKHQYLADAYESLRTQEMPQGWDWEWLVQEDGDSGKPAKVLPSADPRILPGTGRRGNAAVARTLALSRASGLLLRALDADDLLPAGALSRDITALADHPDIAWCVSAALDLLPDGSLRPGPRDPDPGRLPPGCLASGEQAGMLQVVGGTMCTYTDLVRALGGWQALPAEEDVALALAVEAVGDGWMIGEPGLFYRRWGGNSTEDTDNRLPSAPTAQRTVILQRVATLKELGWRWTARS